MYVVSTGPAFGPASWSGPRLLSARIANPRAASVTRGAGSVGRSPGFGFGRSLGGHPERARRSDLGRIGGRSPVIPRAASAGRREPTQPHRGHHGPWRRPSGQVQVTRSAVRKCPRLMALLGVSGSDLLRVTRCLASTASGLRMRVIRVAQGLPRRTATDRRAPPGAEQPGGGGSPSGASRRGTRGRPGLGRTASAVTPASADGTGFVTSRRSRGVQDQTRGSRNVGSPAPRGEHVEACDGLGAGSGSYSEAGPKLERGCLVVGTIPCEAARCWEDPGAGRFVATAGGEW